MTRSLKPRRVGIKRFTRAGHPIIANGRLWLDYDPIPPGPELVDTQLLKRVTPFALEES
jgi:hypothetical protein